MVSTGTVEVSSGSSIPVIGVDLDETVCATVQYWMAKLLTEFPLPGSPNAEDLIKQFRFAQNVPGWDGQKAKERMEFFRKDPGVHLELPVIKDAVDVLASLSMSLNIEYVTMRNPAVESATRLWLKQNKFPEGDLTISPEDLKHEDKPHWKARVLSDRYPSLVGIIEDHPGVVESLPSNYQGTVFLYSHEKSPREDIRVIPCPTWQDVGVAVRRELPRLLNLEVPL